MSDLIDNDNKSWKENIIREICIIPPDAEEILNTPIYRSDTEDIIAWHPEKSGNFTVGSDYSKSDREPAIG